MNRCVLGAVVAAALLTACSGGSGAGTAPDDIGADPEAAARPTTTAGPDDQRFPEILDARATPSGDGTWTFAVTISSPYDTPQRYADGWRVLGPDGAEYGLRVLAHDHANEQPFTRSLSGVAIPTDVDLVLIEARDLANGWSGVSFQLALP